MGEFKIRDMRFLDEDRQKTVKIGQDSFVIKALFSRDHREISRKVAIEQNGLAVNSFSMDDRYRFLRDVSIDHSVVQSPEWWTNAGDCPDESVLDQVYEEIQRWSNEFSDLLKKNRFNRRSAKDEISS